jgi:hypothetical protein
MMHPKAPKVERARIDRSMDGASRRSSPRPTHCPNIQNEAVFKSNLDIYISCRCQKYISFVAFIQESRPPRLDGGIGWRCQTEVLDWTPSEASSTCMDSSDMESEVFFDICISCRCQKSPYFQSLEKN